MKSKFFVVRNKACNYLYDVVVIKGRNVQYLKQLVDFEKASSIVESHVESNSK